MNLKNMIEKYISFYGIYKTAVQENAYDREGIVEACKEKILEKNLIQKDYTFYMLELNNLVRTWNSSLCFSKGEAQALKSYLTHQRYHDKWWDMTLTPKIEANIKTLTLNEILNDKELFSSFVSRIATIVPYDEDEVKDIPSDLDVDVFWNFSHHGEHEYIYHNGEDFLFSTHKEAKLPSSIRYNYTELINEDGKYGVIYNKTKSLRDEPEFEIVVNFTKYYINISNSTLAEVQENEPSNSDDFKEYTCKIINLENNIAYEHNALCNTLDSDCYINIDFEENMQFVKVDTKTNQKTVTKKYQYIANPIYYAPKAVQDIETGLWGYIDKNAVEIIEPKFKDFGSFNDGFAVIKEENQEFIIDEEGNVLIEPSQSIEHFEDNFFFVQRDGLYAVFKKDKIYIDFFDAKDEIQKIKDENNFNTEELTNYLQELYCRKTMYFTGDDNPIYILLRLKIVEKRRELYSKRDELPIKEYVKLFDKIKSEKTLSQIGLLGKSVEVLECDILTSHKSELKDPTKGRIGLSYPVSASMFDMSVELPVEFEKKDNSILTLGIKFECLKLLK